MNKNIINRIWLLMVFTAMTAQLHAQNGINSPYSQYGIGFSNMPYNFPALAATGGVAYTRAASNMINPFNPASYATINKETFVFDMGLSIDMTKLHSNDASLYDADGNLGYLSFAFPITRWWKTALGIMPYSDVNYASTKQSTLTLGGEVKTVYEGTGGVSQLFWGNGFNILGSANDATKPALRAGFNINLLYGNITRAATYDFVANDTTYMMNSRRQKDSYIKNLLFDFGLQYDQPVGDKHHLSLALTMTPHRLMSINENALVYTFVRNASTEYMRDTIFPAAGEDSEFQSNLEQPFTTGIGISFQRDNLWLVAADATFSAWSGLKYSEDTEHAIFGNSTLQYSNSQRYALGLQLLGDKNAANYIRRITFSTGFHYESGRLNLSLSDGNSYQLNEWGFGLGVSLPMRKGRSVLNITTSYSSFGTADLIRRDLFSIGISVGSCESWFVKRKFN